MQKGIHFRSIQMMVLSMFVGFLLFPGNLFGLDGENAQEGILVSQGKKSS